jgi:hypothetical protein
MINATHIQ